MTRRPVLLYLHLPKTAGLTFTTIIFNEYNDSTASREEDGLFCSGVYYFPGELGFMRPSRADEPSCAVHPPAIVQALGRSDLRAVVGHFSFGLHTRVDGPTTYATLFRHPLERIVSLYYHMKRWPSYGQTRPWLKRAGLGPLDAGISLDDFIRHFPLRELDNDQTRRVAGCDPEYGACTRSLLDTAKSNIERFFSLVGVTERFDETLRVANDVLGWSSKSPEYRRNVNEERPPTSSIARETREAILERNALDLELYAFANEWLDDRLRAVRT